jgi:hypothetical protein
MDSDAWDSDAWDDDEEAVKACAAADAITRPRTAKDIVGWCVLAQNCGKLGAPPLMCADLPAAIRAAHTLSIELGLGRWDRDTDPTVSDFAPKWCGEEWRTYNLYGRRDITLFPLFARS